MPHALYVNDGRKLYRYDVLGRTRETVFDVKVRVRTQPLHLANELQQ